MGLAIACATNNRIVLKCDDSPLTGASDQRQDLRSNLLMTLSYWPTPETKLSVSKLLLPLSACICYPRFLRFHCRNW